MSNRYYLNAVFKFAIDDEERESMQQIAPHASHVSRPLLRSLLDSRDT